jgi:hypothetical protein
MLAASMCVHAAMMVMIGQKMAVVELSGRSPACLDGE